MGFNFERQRAQMVAEQLVSRGIRDTAVLSAMGQIPREHFVPSAYLEHAYRDGPIPLPSKQTISQPYVVAYMLSVLALKPTERVLEVGTGSGYAAAVLSKMVREVYTVERQENLIPYARERLDDLAIDNVHIFHGDGSLGWPEHAPYDAIIVAAGGPHVPPALQTQLAENGRLIIPVGKRKGQRLIMVRRQGPEAFVHEPLVTVRFVPLVGEEAWNRGE